ncbi:30S ribosomal protein S13 [Candidatus Woesearchaeota archaeon]|nr:30S ribosomal protein S13 [Candidatus Woesearchaeota archaeon]
MTEENKDFNHIVRVLNTDLDGNKPVSHALLKIQGVGFMLSNAVCHSANVNKYKKIGYLAENEVHRLEEVLHNPLKCGLPVWLLNRRKDVETGENKHLIGADLKFQSENDIKMLKKIRSYRGVRHTFGLPVRGQKTKSNFRDKRTKKAALGVQRKKVGAPAAPKAEAGAKKK